MMNNNFPLLESLSKNFYIADLRDNPELTKEIQTLLKDGGFLQNNVNGNFDSLTEVAFKNFKKNAFLEYPDVLGISTAKALLEIAGKGSHPSPIEAGYTAKGDLIKGKKISLPGKNAIDINQPIFGCQHFTWSEATKNGTRIPTDTLIVSRIIAMAKYLDLVRAIFNRNIFITSWYRPILINTQVGGVANSRHLVGDAVDFIVEGIPPYQVYTRLDNWHGARGGLGKSTAFTHLDLRAYPARWLYGNA